MRTSAPATRLPEPAPDSGTVPAPEEQAEAEMAVGEPG
jgi:hypothetical protein